MHQVEIPSECEFNSSIQKPNEGNKIQLKIHDYSGIEMNSDLTIYQMLEYY